jgi:EAL domain-containing protein (putative c-di-GMP-specific phosphodiesterase class I)/FixJ family two-component response regulator
MKTDSIKTKAVVYLIDDEPEMVNLLCDVVEQVGFNAQSFTQGTIFFEQVKVFKKGELLVLDLHMPEMDGVEIMRQLTTMENPPAIILTSGTDSGVLHAAEKLGRAHNLEILASLSKPVSIRQFQSLLEGHLQGEQENQQDSIQTVEEQISYEELYDAIHNNQLLLHYQPQIEINSGILTGVEALVRWQHPQQGLLYPDRFISFAEKNDLMGDLTYCVIDKAIQQVQLWQNESIAVPVSVNISASDITSLTLPEQLTELLKSNQLEPSKLLLEVTESALMDELITSLDILTRLRLKGIGLSIDDFGTGYSSLSQLHRVPFTELKIDQSFIFNMTEDSEAKAIVKTCIILGHELNMRVVAEGVETKEHLQLLEKMGCDIAQGYLFSKAVSAKELKQKWLIPNKSRI